VKEVETVKEMTEVQFSAIARDGFIGHLLMSAFGAAYSCVKFPVSSISGTFTEGETITETTSSATGTLRRNDQDAGTAALYIVPVSGTFTGGQTLTGGTSSATATGGTIESPSAVRSHIFRRVNTNTHPSYTIYGSDPVSDDRALYCMLDSLDLEAVVGDYVKFNANFLGKALASTTAQTPSYTAQNPFLTKHATFKLAADHDSLDAAAAIGVERFTLNIPKNLLDITEFGSTDPASFHNQEFGDITGEVTLKYNAVTYRDYVLNATKRAMRLTVANTGVTIGSSASPTLQLDFPSVGFREWGRPTENAGIVKQTLQFTAEYNIARALTLEGLLQNTDTTGY